MKHAFAAATVAATILLALSTTPLAAQDYVPDRLKKSVTQADLAAVAGSLGHQVLEQGEGEDVFLVVQTVDATNYFLFGTACDVNDVPGCQGIMMQMRFELPPTTTFETLAKANLEQAALNSWADFDNKTLGFTRYQVLDNGVTMANIRENVSVLLALVADAYPVAAGEE